MPNNFCIDLKW